MLLLAPPHLLCPQDSLLALLETPGTDAWSRARAWLQPALAGDAPPYLDCALVSYTAAGGTTRHRLVDTVFRARSDAPATD